GALRGPRDAAGGRAAPQAAVSGRARRARPLARRPPAGARLGRLARAPGERTIRIERGGGLLVARLSGPAPAATLVVEGRPVATLGEGVEAWPVPAEAPEREWDRVPAEAVRAALDAAAAGGRTPARAVPAVCPGLGPYLARALPTGAAFAALREAPAP